MFISKVDEDLIAMLDNYKLAYNYLTWTMQKKKNNAFKIFLLWILIVYSWHSKALGFYW